MAINIKLLKQQIAKAIFDDVDFYNIDASIKDVRHNEGDTDVRIVLRDRHGTSEMLVVSIKRVM